MAAHEIVSDFNNEGVTLNDGVVKKAAELGLNRDQTCRLIERTNSEAFLSKFPASTEFKVADPAVVLKTAGVVATGIVEKNASYHSRLDRDPYDIFGVVEGQEKVAGFTLKTAKDIFKERVDAAATLDDLAVEKTAKLLEMEEADANLWHEFKNEALSGRPVSDIERELVLAFPEKTAAVCATVTYLTEKLASATYNPVSAYDRLQVEDINPKEVVLSSKLTNAFAKIAASTELYMVDTPGAWTHNAKANTYHYHIQGSAKPKVTIKIHGTKDGNHDATVTADQYDKDYKYTHTESARMAIQDSTLRYMTSGNHGALNLMLPEE